MTRMVTDIPILTSDIPKNPYLEKWDQNLAKAFYELSRLKYGRDRLFIQKEIEYRIGV